MATYKKPASMETSSFIDKEGQYHLLVNLVDEQPLSKDNAALDGIGLEASCIGGNEPSQVKRTFRQTLFNPSENHRDGGEFATRVHLRLADACGLLGNADADEEVEIDWSKAKGAQIVVYLKTEIGKDKKERLQIDGAHIYHVDDPEVAHVPKNEQMLKLLPAAMRRKQSAPPADKKSTPPKSGNAGKVSTPPTTTTQSATYNPDDI